MPCLPETMLKLLKFRKKIKFLKKKAERKKLQNFSFLEGIAEISAIGYIFRRI